MSTRNWGRLALRGAAALLSGILAFWYPGRTLAVLVVLFGAYAPLDGIFTVVAAVVNRRERSHWAALLIAGLVGIVVGVLTFAAPGVTATVLLYYIAAWANRRRRRPDRGRSATPQADPRRVAAGPRRRTAHRARSLPRHPAGRRGAGGGDLDRRVRDRHGHHAPRGRIPPARPAAERRA